ncbi:MAG: chromosome segregation ATPase [Reinekea sp.]|jgi:chromosome segregation ATPase
MSSSVHVVMIVNLAVLVMGLGGFVVYQLTNYHQSQRGLRGQIKQLKGLLTRLRGALEASPDGDNRDQESANALRTHQLNILNATLDLEERIAHTDPSVVAQLAAQVNALKTQATYAHKLSEQLGAQAHSRRVGRLSLENKLQQKQAALNKARSVNDKLKDHYAKIKFAHKQILERLMELRATKEQLTQAADENSRLNAQLEDLHRLQGS